MINLVTALTQMNFLGLVWIFFAVFVLHELEEWNIDRFEHRNFEGLPSAATDRSARMWIGFVILIGLIWSTAASLPGNPSLAAWIFLPAVAILLQNAIQHIYWSIHFRQYAPGLVTSILLLVPLAVYLIGRAIMEGYVPIGYVAALAVFVLLGIAQTLLAGNQMTYFIRSINNIGIWLSDRIG
jgi:hypothetical protein